MKTANEKTRRLVTLALLAALVVAMQAIASFFPSVTPVNLTLVPIVIGAILCGPSGGAFLGGVFTVIVLAAGISGKDAFTHLLLEMNPISTVALCIVKGVGCGAAAGLVYKMLDQKNRVLACVLASATAPIVNTGFFTLWMLTLLRGAFEEIAASYAVGDAVQWLFVGILGVNFAIEFISNTVLSSAIAYITKVVKKR